MSRDYPSSDETTIDVDPHPSRGLLNRRGTASGGRGPATYGDADIILIAHPDNSLLGRRFSLKVYGKLTFGRSSQADVSMPKLHSVSRIHAQVNHRGDRVVIEDLRSTNGTFINNMRIQEPQVLVSGDRFQVGAAHFKFLNERDPENAYHEAIYQLVIRDGLTQAYNKRKFDEELPREIARARRHDRPLSLILFDVDHFKDVNDQHGHLCGDAVLQQLSRAVAKQLRPEQLFARVGGEEFVILNPETDSEGAQAMAERLRKAVEQHTFRHGDLTLNITCSFGVAALEGALDQPEGIYDAADRAMYASKKNGRNRVTRAGQSSQS